MKFFFSFLLSTICLSQFALASGDDRVAYSCGYNNDYMLRIKAGGVELEKGGTLCSAAYGSSTDPLTKNPIYISKDSFQSECNSLGLGAFVFLEIASSAVTEGEEPPKNMEVFIHNDNAKNGLITPLSCDRL